MSKPKDGQDLEINDLGEDLLEGKSEDKDPQKKKNFIEQNIK